MSKKELKVLGWVTGGILCSAALLVHVAGYYEVKLATIRADAWVGVAREIGEAIAGLGGK